MFKVSDAIYEGARPNKFSYFYVALKYLNISHIIIMLPFVKIWRNLTIFYGSRIYLKTAGLRAENILKSLPSTWFLLDRASSIR